MQIVIHTLALGAALIALVAGLWQDWGTFTTLKRMFISYLAFYFLGAGMALVVRLVGAMEKPGSAGDETPPAAGEKAAK